MPASGQRATSFGDALADYAKLSFSFLWVLSGACRHPITIPLYHRSRRCPEVFPELRRCSVAIELRKLSALEGFLLQPNRAHSPRPRNASALAELSHHLLSSLHDETLLRRVFNLRLSLSVLLSLSRFFNVSAYACFIHCSIPRQSESVSHLATGQHQALHLHLLAPRGTLFIPSHSCFRGGLNTVSWLQPPGRVSNLLLLLCLETRSE